MRRRAFVAALGASVSGLSGCVGSVPNPLSTPTPSPTRTPDYDPTVNAVRTVTDWKEYGDTLANQTNEVPPDEPVLVAAQFTVICGEDDELRWRFDARIEDAGSEVVATGGTEAEEFDSNCRTAVSSEWEQWVSMHYDNEFGATWPTGDYTAMVRIEDFYGSDSAFGSWDFSVVSG